MNRTQILKKIIIGVAIALVAVIVILLILAPFNTTKKFDASEYNYSMNFSIELDGIPIFPQETGFTCFVVSMVIMKTYLGYDTTELELIQNLGLQDRTKGMLPNEYLPYAREVFEPLSYSVTLLNPNSEAEILNIITASLIDGLPVIFFYSAMDDWNKPSYNTHYGVIYGIDLENQIVKLSNPYGYLDELTFAELFDGLTFRSYESEPFMHIIGRKVGYIRYNNIFVFENIS